MYNYESICIQIKPTCSVVACDIVSPLAILQITTKPAGPPEIYKSIIITERDISIFLTHYL